MPRGSGTASDERMRKCESLAEAVAAVFANDGDIGTIVLWRAAVLLEKRTRGRGCGATDERMRQAEQFAQAISQVFVDDVDIAPIVLRRAAMIVEAKSSPATGDIKMRRVGDPRESPSLA